MPYSRNEYKDMLAWSGPPLFDYGITEWHGPCNVAAFWSIARGARDKNTAFIFTYARPDVAGNRLAIAAAYAGGMHIVAPWDVFTGSTTPRVFGTAAEYGDLFGFVRGVRPWLDGYEDAGSCSADSHDSRWGAAPLLHLVGAENVHAAVRAKPGMTRSPVVVHLVDSSPAPQAFKVALDLSRLGGQPVKATLLEPMPFDAAAHEKAAATGRFTALVKQTTLSTGEETLLSIPPLASNWGILILSPVQSTPLTPQPFFESYQEPFPLMVNTTDDRIKLATIPGMIEGHVFQWDGRSRLSAARCGQQPVNVACDPVTSFGTSASLAIPFWWANRNHAGDLFELIVFKRPLSTDERRAVERMLTRKYGLR